MQIDEQIMRIDEVLTTTGLSKTTLWRRIQAGEFPTQVRLGGYHSRAVGWRRSDIEAWIACLVTV